MMNPSPLAGALSDMEKFGYSYSLLERMLPVDEELAIRLFDEGCEVNLLYSDGRKRVVATEEEIEAHVNTRGMLGVTEHDLEYEYKKSEKYFVGEGFI